MLSPVKHMTLRQARDARKWTQAELSYRSRVPQSRIAEIETGKTRDPQNATVKALEEALGVPRGTLIFGKAKAA